MGQVACIDIGTVTSRLALSEVRDGRVRRLDKTSTITNLGEGLAATGRLSDAAVGRVLACVDGYLARTREAGVTQLCCTLTSAARDATNSDVLLDALVARGVVAQVIPGEVEGSLTLLGVCQDFVGQLILVADNGGGSTELALGRLQRAAHAGGAAGSVGTAYAPEHPDNGEESDVVGPAVDGMDGDGAGIAPDGAADDGAVLDVRAVRSVDVGCRRITERCLPGEGPASPDELAAAHAFARMPFEATVANLGLRTCGAERLVVTGGTVTSLIAIRDELVPYDSSRVHLHELALSQIEALEQRLAACSVAERARIPGLQPQRASVILGGAVAVSELVRATGFDVLTVSESDLLVGLSLVTHAAATGAAPLIPWTPALTQL